MVEVEVEIFDHMPSGLTNPSVRTTTNFSVSLRSSAVARRTSSSKRTPASGACCLHLFVVLFLLLIIVQKICWSWWWRSVANSSEVLQLVVLKRFRKQQRIYICIPPQQRYFISDDSLKIWNDWIYWIQDSILHFKFAVVGGPRGQLILVNWVILTQIYVVKYSESRFLSFREWPSS